MDDTPITAHASSAVSQVFHIPELLEAILLRLSIKDLLLSQRTSRAFQLTVQGSIRLKRKLFFEPDWNLEGRPFDAYAPVNRPGRKPENNRLLLRAFPGCYPTITLVIVSDGQPGSQATFQSANGSAMSGRRGSESWSWDVCISFPADGRPSICPAVEYPEASWRKMYLSQPPCSTLYLVRRWQRSLRPAIIRENGITMGDFVDEATKDAPGCGDRKWHQSYISSDRDWHFEGNLKCNMVEDSTPENVRNGLCRLLQDYAYSRTLYNGAVVALSDTWDPGSAWLHCRYWTQILVQRAAGVVSVGDDQEDG